MNIETANRLLQYRKKHNLSQEELANKIGVSRQAVSKWERAEASPDTDNLVLLAQLYGVSLDELIMGSQTDGGKAEEQEVNNQETEQPEQESEQPQEEPAPTGDEGVEYQSYDKVSFKNGIHVDTKSGDKVHISFADGIHINDKSGTKVDIDKNGVSVNENGRQRVYTAEDGHIMYDSDMPTHRSDKKFWLKFPFFIIAIAAFLAWGFSGVCFGWALSWITLLSIPLYYSLAEAIYKRSPSHFAYPVLTAAAYILMGYFNVFGGWAIGWVVFLTIPVYYWICSFFKNEKNKDKY